MWNSSRRIALFSTSLILLGAGLFGAAWLAHWLPIEIGEAETGDPATQQTLAELDALDWSGFSNRDDVISGVDANASVLSQREPALSAEPHDSPFANSGGFVDRNRWISDNAEEGHRHRNFTYSDEQPEPVSIPSQFPDSNRFPDDRNIQQVSGSSDSGFGAAANRGAVRSVPTNDVGNSPPRLFDAEEPPTYGEAQAFPTEVAFADRAAELDLFAPEESEASAEAPPFESNSGSQTDQTGDAAVRTAARSNITEPTSSSPDDTNAEAMLAEIDQLLTDRNFVAAHRELSTLYWNNPDLKSTIIERIEKNAQTIYFSPQPHFLDPYEIQSGDLLQRVAPKYRINWEYLAALNRVDPRRIRAGQKLKVIKGPFSAFVDLSDFELTVHCHGFFVKRYQVGIGHDSSSTPVGKFVVLERIAAPQYTDPDGKVIEGGHPTNPLGTHWIDLGDSYGIHGTIEPESIGKAESAGCVRMRNEDVVEVYNFLVRGSEVVIRP